MTASTERVRAEAGRTGDDVRSDLHVSVEVADTGGVQVEVASKVEALYGDDLRRRVRQTVRRLGEPHLRVRVEDQGALPWVVEARLEAALARVGVRLPPSSDEPTGPGHGRRTTNDHREAPSPRSRLRRSRLYLPGDEPKFMINAGLHGPDAVILDLEDSVHPDRKTQASFLVRNALTALDFGGAERMVRINQLPAGLEDLETIVPAGPDLILIPKTEHPEQVERVAAVIDGLRNPDEPDPEVVGSEVDARPPPHPIWLMPILESALGVENAFDIAAAHPTVVALTIGLEDYTADLGVAKTSDGEESLWARRRLVNAARAAGVQAIDSVYGDVDDEEGLLAWGRRARSMGFEGMGCIHPRQIRTIHRAFAPDEAELERALRIVDAFRAAEEKGLGVVSLGSKMIDAPVVLRARRLVERARSMGLIATAPLRDEPGGDGVARQPEGEPAHGPKGGP